MLIYIDSAGRVGPCPFLNHSTENILEKDYIAILKSKTLASFRQRAKNDQERPCHCHETTARQ